MQVTISLSKDYPNPQMYALKGRVLLTKTNPVTLDVDDDELASLVSNPHVVLDCDAREDAREDARGARPTKKELLARAAELGLDVGKKPTVDALIAALAEADKTQ